MTIFHLMFNLNFVNYTSLAHISYFTCLSDNDSLKYYQFKLMYSGFFRVI